MSFTSRSLRLSYRDAVFGDLMSEEYLKNPTDRCLAFYIEKCPIEMSEYLGLVRERAPGGKLSDEKAARPFHFMAPAIDYEDAVDEVKHRVWLLTEEKFKIHIVGEMQAVGDVVGIARLGSDEKHYIDHVKDKMDDPDTFEQYLDAYLDTQEGHAELISHYARNTEEMSEWDKTISEDNAFFKMDYINSRFVKNSGSYVLQHKNMLSTVIKEDDVKQRAAQLFSTNAVMVGAVEQKDLMRHQQHIEKVCSIISCLKQ